MVKYQILYWKHVPAQVKVFEEGKRPVSRQIPESMVKIDRIAMEEGITGTDAYLSHWNWSGKQDREGAAEEVADALIRELQPTIQPNQADEK